MHLSVHAPSSSPHQHTRLVWQHQVRLKGSINNSILLTSLSLNRSNESSAEPRIAISNNDCCVTFYDIPLRASSTHRQLKEVGHVALDVPVNHCMFLPLFPAHSNPVSARALSLILLNPLVCYHLPSTFRSLFQHQYLRTAELFFLSATPVMSISTTLQAVPVSTFNLS